MRRRLASLALSAALGLLAPALAAGAEPAPTRHFAANGNFDEHGRFAPGRIGFDIADVSGRSELDALPGVVKGLVWVGSCAGADEAFRAKVSAVIDHPRLFGFYLMDDPDPRGRWRPACPPDNLRAQADWIHARRPDALTFVALMNANSSAAPAFETAYAPARTHVDLFSIAPYPCRIEWTACDIDMIDRFVAAAVRDGFPREKLVPTYQTFGLGAWRTDTGGRYRTPTQAELKAMLARWQSLVPAPALDYAYSWGEQRGAQSLSGAADLQEAFAERHRAQRRKLDD